MNEREMMEHLTKPMRIADFPFTTHGERFDLAITIMRLVREKKAYRHTKALHYPIYSLKSHGPGTDWAGWVKMAPKLSWEARV